MSGLNIVEMKKLWFPISALGLAAAWEELHFKFTFRGQKHDKSHLPMPVGQLKAEMLTILGSDSKASAQELEASVDSMLEEKSGYVLHMIRAIKDGDKLVAFSAFRAWESRIRDKSVIVTIPSLYVAKGVQNRKIMSVLMSSPAPNEFKDWCGAKEETEVWNVVTAASPISFQVVASRFVDVYPSAKHPKLDDFPDEVRELYTTAKRLPLHYSDATHVSDFVIQTPSGPQPQTEVDESRLNADGRFFLSVNPNWRHQHLVFLMANVRAENFVLPNVSKL